MTPVYRMQLLLFSLAIAASSTFWPITCSARPLIMPPSSRMLVLVPSPSPSLSYHGGALLTVPRLRVHLLFYGSFSTVQQAAVTDFIASFQAKAPAGSAAPAVASWWKTSQQYKDAANAVAAKAIKPGIVFTDTAYSKGKSLTDADVGALVDALYAKNKNTRSSSVFAVITADDVEVEDFCMNSCGTHSAAPTSKMPYIWVGNAGKQCPGLCAWPFALMEGGPPGPALLPPSGDVAADGIIINLAMLLAGTVTNPFDTGYYEGDASIPVEAGSACEGKFGPGSYPGYAGKLLKDAAGASYNYVGLNGREFLLPALWNPSSLTCQVPNL